MLGCSAHGFNARSSDTFAFSTCTPCRHSMSQHNVLVRRGSIGHLQLCRQAHTACTGMQHCKPLSHASTHAVRAGGPHHLSRGDMQNSFQVIFSSCKQMVYIVLCGLHIPEQHVLTCCAMAAKSRPLYRVPRAHTASSTEAGSQPRRTNTEGTVSAPTPSMSPALPHIALVRVRRMSISCSVSIAREQHSIAIYMAILPSSQRHTTTVLAVFLREDL